MGSHDFSDLSHFSVDVLAELEHRGLYDPEQESWSDLTPDERRERLLDLYSRLQETFDGIHDEFTSRYDLDFDEDHEIARRIWHARSSSVLVDFDVDDDDEAGHRLLQHLQDFYLYDPEVEIWNELPVEEQHDRLESLGDLQTAATDLRTLRSELEDYLRESLPDAIISTGGPASPGADFVRLALDVLDATVAQLPNGEDREGQRRMCELVAKTLASGKPFKAGDGLPHQDAGADAVQPRQVEHLAVQAGTGIGKTFAYGVPAALTESPVVIATATKALQDQLHDDDMPRITRAVHSLTGTRPKVAVLKGRENYICCKRVDLLRGEPEAEEGPLKRLIDFAANTEAGDRADLDFEPAPEDWSEVSVSSAECLGKTNCSFGDTCFTEIARDEAAEADVIIVNHALYSLYLSKGGTLLPSHEAVIIDEAHQFVQSVQSVADIAISQTLIGPIIRLAREKCADAVIDRVNDATSELSAAILDRQKERQAVPHIELAEGKSRLALALQVLEARLVDLQSAVNEDRHRQLSFDVADASEHSMLLNLIDSVLDDFRAIGHEVCGGEAPTTGFCVHAEKQSIPAFCGIKLSVSDYVDERINDRPAVLTSATLDTRIVEQLGIAERCSYETMKSPFDYETHALLYLPKRLPALNDKFRDKSILEVVRELCASCDGGSLVLFTSWDALERIHHLLSRTRSHGVYRQGEQYTNAQLIHKLRTEPKTVVCATKTFWNGVDLPGDALHLLVIDKIPFPAYTKPPHVVLDAHLKAHGKSGFDELSVPQAARELAQGLGRLIRSTSDQGVAVVLDSRLTTADYRHRVLELVPPMKRTHDFKEAVSFLEGIGSVPC